MTTTTVHRSLVASVVLIGVCAAIALAQNQTHTENVILVSLDGLRWEEVFSGADEALMDERAGGVTALGGLRQAFWRDTPEARRQSLMPFFWSVVAADGQVFGNRHLGSDAVVTNGMVFSYPGYNEMLTGFPDDRIDSNDKVPNPNVTVLEWLAGRAGLRGRVAAFTAWEVFPYILNEERSGIPVNSGWEPLDDHPLTAREQMLNDLMAVTPHPTDVRLDGFTFHAAMEHLVKRQPRVLYISFDETDAAAHARRYDDYLNAAHRSDELLRRLWETLQSMPAYAGKTSLVVTTDHGRGGAPDGWRAHGVDVVGAEFVWIAVLGPDTPSLGQRADIETVSQGQVAATVAALLGADYGAEVPAAAPPLPGVLDGS